MFKRQFTYFIIVLFVIGLALLLPSFLNEKKYGSYSATVTQSVPADIPIPQALDFAGEQVPLHIHYVREALEQELIVNTYWHSSTILTLKRSHRWLPFIDSMLRAHHIPADFKYLCIAESGLKNEVSPAGAAGFWQIMKATGREYGLEVNTDIDERYLLEKATKVACAYLQKAYDEFGSWTLAAASYNAGMNKIRKELVRQGEQNYYRMNFREETARYMFRILALKHIISNPDAYGFYICQKALYQPIEQRYIQIDTTVQNLGKFAQQLGVSYRELKYYNPWLRTSKLPNKSRKLYQLALPVR